MAGWDDDFRELAREFLAGGDARLAQLRAVLAELEQSPDAPPLLAELKRSFHRLAGAGATFGYQSISEVARRGERLCDEVIARDGAASASDVATWAALATSLERAFRSGDESGAQVVTTRLDAGERSPRATTDVLVVDDDEAVLALLVHLLAQEGMTVRAAGSRREAQTLIDAKLPDGLVVDIDLPDGSGYSVVEHLRGLRGGDVPAVVIVSLKSDVLDYAEAIHAGADAYFEKPFDWGALVRKLNQLLERAAAEVPRVLVVEDDPSHAGYARAILESAGYDVSVCESPRQFTEMLSAYRPDLVLMDIGLPEVDGFDLTRLVRQDDRHVTLPIVFTTGNAQLDARIQTMKSGGDDYLVKPVPPALLSATVAARLERARFLKTLLTRDGLTRLLTHASFMDQAHAVVAQKRRYPGVPAALAMIDVDLFKAINDTHGHQAGDRVLMSLSGILGRRLRRSDLVGRYGGEEFAVLLDHLDEAQTVRLLYRLLGEFSSIDHHGPDGRAFRATFSAGVAMFDSGAADLKRWMQAADAALYAAKRAGRNRVVTTGQVTTPGAVMAEGVAGS